MIKNSVILFILIMTVNTTIAMHNDNEQESLILQKQLLKECRNSLPYTIENLITKNPTIDINYQDRNGITALLHAARYDQWSNVSYLLKQGANKSLRNNNNQSLFSISLYNNYWPGFDQILNHYTPTEIQQEVTALLVIDTQRHKSIPLFILQVLNHEIDINTMHQTLKTTALHIAIDRWYIPQIVQLLELNASLTMRDGWKQTPLDALKSNQKLLFIIREALNKNFLTIPTHILLALYHLESTLLQNTIPDVRHIIAAFYFQLPDTKKEIVKKLWEPKCFTKILFMSPLDRTELNKELFLSRYKSAYY